MARFAVAARWPSRSPVLSTSLGSTARPSVNWPTWCGGTMSMAKGNSYSRPSTD